MAGHSPLSSPSPPPPNRSHASVERGVDGGVQIPREDDAEGVDVGWSTPRPRVLAPALFLFLGLMVAALLGVALRRQERDMAVNAAGTELERIVEEITHRIIGEVNDLDDIAHGWGVRGGIGFEEWSAEAQRLVERHRHIQAIEWVDSSFRVRWIMPLAGNEQAQDLDLGFEERRREALERSRDSRIPVFSRPVELVQGGTGLLAFLPIHTGDRFQGFILGVYRIDALMDAILHNLSPHAMVEITQEGSSMYRREASEPGAVDWLRLSGEARILDRRWEITIQPGRSFERIHMTRLPAVVSGSAALISVLVAFLIHNGRLSRWRSARMAEANVLLQEEVSGRRKAQRELHGAKEDLERVMSSVPNHLWSHQYAPNGDLVQCFHSPVVESITGRPAEFYVDGLEPWLCTAHREDEPRVRAAFEGIKAGVTDRVSIEFRIMRLDGRARWIHTNIQATALDDGGRRLDGVVTDVNERKVAEKRQRQHAEKLFHADRVHTLGRMTSSIAHELNQPLLAIMNFASVCKREVAAGQASADSILDDLEEIVQQGERAGEIIRRLKNFVRTRELERSLIDVNEVIRDSLNFIDFEMRKQGSNVVLELDPARPRTSGDPLLIQQVVLNLVRNALDAGVEGDENGKCVRVRTSRPAEDLVEIAVVDSGPGVDEENLEHLFEPFFSTKADGLGMGLSICQSIVESHDGTLTAQPNDGGGMSFAFTLPMAGEETT